MKKLDDPKELLRLSEVAILLGLSQQTLYNWRTAGDRGPRSAKIGSHVVYRRSEVDAWVEAQFAQSRGDSIPTAG